MEQIIDNPFLVPSTLPYGLPDFANLAAPAAIPAVEYAIREEENAWQQIAKNPEPPTVANTIEAVEDAGELLGRILPVVYELSSSIGGEKWEAVLEVLSPKLAEHYDLFYQNLAIYQRYVDLRAQADLDEETQWLLTSIICEFEQNGVQLPEGKKTQLRLNSQRIAKLESQISARISKQLSKLGVSGSNLTELEGLTASEIESAKANALERKKAGLLPPEAIWFLEVQNYTTQDAQASLRSPKIRQRVLDNSLARGFGQDSETDTRALILDLVLERAKRAQLLGFENYAALSMANQTVPSLQEALNLVKCVGRAAKTGITAEAKHLQDQAQQDGISLQAAHWPYYEAIQKHQKLGVSTEILRPYLELNQVITEGVFYAANRLYGLTFKERTDLQGWTPTVRIWEVFTATNHALGLFCGDWFKHDGKAGGAWMTTLNEASGRKNRLPIVTNDANFSQPEPGQPALLTWDNVETCFHEFGHALHALLSKTRYAQTAGTSTATDFVEVPSQLNEMWAYHPEVIRNFARHWKTGEILPAEQIQALVRSKYFGQAFPTLEQVQAVLIDLGWHALTPLEVPTEVEEVSSFEESLLENFALKDDLVPPRYRTCYFAHSFTDSYAASYYSYFWSEAMVGELEEWFHSQEKNGDGGLNRQAGDLFRQEILRRGNSRNPLDSFVALCGTLPAANALIYRRKLPLVSLEE